MQKQQRIAAAADPHLEGNRANRHAPLLEAGKKCHDVFLEVCSCFQLP
jgi:hypothetical protein